MSMETVPVTIDMVASAQIQPAAKQPASMVDIAQFQRSYAEAQQARQAAGPDQAAAASGPESEGFRALLGTLDSLNGRVDQLGDLSKVATSKADLTPGDMLMLSVRCHEFLFHCELTSNVANRTSDGVQQLFRQQS
ncbi:MAG TPA: hypothetical protein VIZ64_04265 [Dokdonella sp.]